MEILIKDFNCLQSVKMDFQPGFNVIQGPSNSGKSSVIKAIEKCIFNQSGSTNVRQGKDNLLVGIKYNDHEVYLTKGKNTKYKVDDQIFEKIGVNQLDQVAEALNIREVILGGEKVRLNFSNQFSYPFLLDKTPGQLYKFIVDSAESESLSDVLKDMSKDIKDLDKSIIQNEARMDILTKQKTDLEGKLVNADEILEVSNKIIALDSTYTSIVREIELRDKYLKDIKDKDILEDNLNKYSIDKDLVEKLDAVKNNYVNSKNKILSYKNTANSINSLTETLNKYSDINTIDLDKAFDSCTIVNKLVNKYKAAYNQVRDIETKLSDFDIALKEEKDKLDKFSICPLCGGELKC